MKKIVFSLLTAFGLALGATAQTIAVADVEAMPGETVKATLNISAPADTYTGFQLALQFPATGFTVAEKATKAVSGWDGMVATGDMKEGKVKVSAANDATFTEATFEVEFTVDDATELGEQTVTVTDIVFEATGVEDAVSDVSFKVNVVKAHTVELDENATEAPAAAEGVNVKVKRTIKADEWSTIVLPFAMTDEQVKAAFGDDVRLADFTGYEYDEEADKINVNFKDATMIEANHPYIIKVTAAVSEFAVEGVDIEPEDEPTNAVVKRTKKAWSEMVGTYVAGTETGENVLVLSQNKFWYTTETTKMKAFRAYFDFYDEVEDKSVASVRIGLNFSDITAITNVKQEYGDSRIYTLAGQQVKQAQKGLYIQNGKKVIIK
ncbi:MAG: hypothetical protein IJU11_03585 [Prevotella sp.]|nr:hypothetical protein [Prevotella sp.]